MKSERVNIGMQKGNVADPDPNFFTFFAGSGYESGIFVSDSALDTDPAIPYITICI